MLKHRIVAAIIAAGLAMTAAGATAAEYEWKFYTYFAVNDLPTNMHRAFAEDLTKATGGVLKVSVYAGGELPYKFSDVLRLVSTNQVQMGDLAVGLNVGELPGMNVFDLPFLCTSYDTFFNAVDVVGATYEKVLTDKFGIGSLIQWTMPPQQIWLTQPIERIDQLKGRKVRIWSAMHSDMLPDSERRASRSARRRSRRRSSDVSPMAPSPRRFLPTTGAFTMSPRRATCSTCR